MLHDLIYALSGNPGSVFKEMAMGKVEVIPGLTHISPSEEAALNRLLHLATRYLYFQKFMAAHMSTVYSPGIEDDVVSSEGLKPGCYLKSFCCGLETVLSEYRRNLLAIEKEILKDEHLSLLYIQHETDHYHVLFDIIHEVIMTIRSRRAHGCQILDVVFKATRSGNAHVRDSLLTILQQCHLVMYNQLSAWLLHGLLIDRHKEFFIKDIRNEEAENASKSEEALSRSGGNGIGDDFHVRLDMLPSYIPNRVASVICFVGTSLHLFEVDNQGQFGADLVANKQLVDVKTADFSLAMEGVLHDKEREFMGDLQKLQRAREFVIEDFDVCIDKIRSAVAKELWLLCVERAQLVSHLYMLKDFFLLGRGELFLAFIEEAGQLLKSPPSRVTEHDVQQAFVRSAARVQMEDELPFQLFQLTISKTSTIDQSGPFVNINTIDDGWSRLGMTFKAKWPLHTIFKPALLEKYNQLFRFLLRVKRTQSALQKIWSIQMRFKQDADIDCDRYSLPKDTPADRLQWRCRNYMQIFIDNLQYYLLADVLESHFTNMLEKIRSTNDAQQDFESIIAAHDNFIHSLLAQSFILSNTVCKNLMEILDICQKFCDVVQTSSLVIAKSTFNDQIAEIWDLYYKKTLVFFHFLTGVSTHQCNPHISQLTLRLDYNRYYSKLILKSNETKPITF